MTTTTKLTEHTKTVAIVNIDVEEEEAEEEVDALVEPGNV